MSALEVEQEDRLRALFHAYDVENSGRIEKKGFLSTICADLHVSTGEAEDIFHRLDVDRDGAVTLLDFITGFHERYYYDPMDMETDSGLTAAWDDFEHRLGDQARFIPSTEQVATLYHNINLTEPRLVPHFERVITNFTREFRQHHSDIENLALAVKRAQDQASMQLSEMEEEMDQRIQATEKKMRQQEAYRTEAALSELRSSYETEVYELQCKIQRMQVIEEKYNNISMKDESTVLKKKINELLLDNQKLKHELLKSQTNIACLQSEMDTLKMELTDSSMNTERDEELMKEYSDERDLLERQIEILQAGNRKLHDTNDGLRTALERRCKVGSGLSPLDRNRSKSICFTSSPYSVMDRFYERMEEERLDSPNRGPNCDSLALAMCDPGLKRRYSSECEEDSLPESYNMDSGRSTLRGSHRGYDSEHEVKGQEEEEEEEENDEHNRRGDEKEDSVMEDDSDTDVTEIQDSESAFGSEAGGSILEWKPSQPLSRTSSGASTTRKPLTAITTQEKKSSVDMGDTTSEKAYRIVLAGDAAVGKSSFLLRLCKNEFRANCSATLGVDFQLKTLVVDGEPTVLQLWDTAGQERFRSIAKSYFRRADGVLLLYDVTCEKSFLNVREWLEMIEDVSPDDIPIMMVANKSDLRQEALENGVSCVPTSCGEKLAMTYNGLFCETSAKDGSNVLEAVLHLAREVKKQGHSDVSSDSLTSLAATKKKSNLSCCT